MNEISVQDNTQKVSRRSLDYQSLRLLPFPANLPFLARTKLPIIMKDL